MRSGEQMAPLKVAIIGAGNTGIYHAAAYRQIPEVQIKYIYSRNPERARSLADQVGAQVVDRWEMAMEDPSIDIVNLCLPTYTRLETIQKAVAEGKHIFCEKPLALNGEMSCKIYGLLMEYKKKFMVGQVLRFFWEYAQMRQMVLSGEVGDVGTIRLSRCVGFPGSWFANRDQSGGVILDLLIHDIDFLLWTFGDVERVYAKGLTYRDGLDMDYALLNIKLKSGAIAHIEGSWAHPAGSFHTTVEIAGSKGLISYDNLSSKHIELSIKKKGATETGPRVSMPEIEPADDPFVLQLRDFVESIREDREPSVTYKEALAACAVAFMALRSLQTGQPASSSA